MTTTDLTPAAPLPENAILLHVGFHKTGTTALQSAFAAARPELREHGTLYPGRLSSHHRAAMALTGRRWGWTGQGGKRSARRNWDEVAEAARGYGGRTVISTEALSLADDAAMDELVRELGADRLYVVMTLRPLARLLPSSWQQYLKYGLTVPYEQWLEQAFENPPKCPPSPNFWRRNDHVGISARWAQRLGPDRVIMVVLDEGDRRFLFRTFEQMLALPDGMLTPDPEVARSNRSMTGAEAEVLRLVNAGHAGQWGWPQYEKLVRRGAILRMVETRRPGPDEPGVGTPEWAVRAAQDVGRRTAQGLADLGITVHGDLENLAAPMPAAAPPDESMSLPVGAAAEGILGTLSAAMTGRAVPPEQDSVDPLTLPAVEALSTRDSVRLLRTRLGDAATRRARRARRSLGGSRRRSG